MTDYRVRFICKTCGTQSDEPVSESDELARLRTELAEIKQTIEKSKENHVRFSLECARLHETLAWAKEQYWNRCYDGSGNVKALTLAEFDRQLEERMNGRTAARAGV